LTHELMVVVTTTGTRAEAQRLAAEAVLRRLAACSQIDGPMESYYVWQGSSRVDEEWRLTLKTTSQRGPALLQWLRETHSYEQPQLVAIPVTLSDPGYARWVFEQTADRNADNDVETR